MADDRAALLTLTLGQYDLLSLQEWAMNALIMDWSEDQVILEMRKRPEFRSRFAGMFMLEEKGEPPISVEQYLQYEQTAHALANMWGMTLTKEEVDNLIGGSVSPVELQARFDITAEAIYESDDETIAELIRYGGINDGDVMRYFMNPQQEMGVLQSRFRQAQIAGAALRTGWGQLTQMQAERLQEAGLTREQAQTGFGEMARMDEVFAPFNINEDMITRDEQVAFLAGDMDAAEKIERRQRERVGEFAGSSSFAQGKEGFAVGAASQ